MKILYFLRWMKNPFDSAPLTQLPCAPFLQEGFPCSAHGLCPTFVQNSKTPHPSLLYFSSTTTGVYFMSAGNVYDIFPKQSHLSQQPCFHVWARQRSEALPSTSPLSKSWTEAEGSQSLEQPPCSSHSQHSPLWATLCVSVTFWLQGWFLSGALQCPACRVTPHVSSCLSCLFSKRLLTKCRSWGLNRVAPTEYSKNFTVESLQNLLGNVLIFNESLITLLTSQPALLKQPDTNS